MIDFVQGGWAGLDAVGLPRLWLGFPWRGCCQTKSATGVAFFLDFHTPPSGKPESGCLNHPGIASPVARLSLAGVLSNKKRHWRGVIS